MKANSRLKRKDYETHLRQIQAELCLMQDRVKNEGLRVIILFEGRDGAGKGGTIKAITERVSPRVFRVVALPAPSDREKSQISLQRYLPHFPAAGEIVIFDRAGTTVPEWNMSWGFVPKKNTVSFWSGAPRLRSLSCRMESIWSSTGSK